MDDEFHLYEIGDEVVPTPYFHQQFEYTMPRGVGRILGRSRRHPSCWRVQWEGIKTPESLAGLFIQPNRPAPLTRHRKGRRLA